MVRLIHSPRSLPVVQIIDYLFRLLQGEKKTKKQKTAPLPLPHQNQQHSWKQPALPSERLRRLHLARHMSCAQARQQRS